MPALRAALRRALRRAPRAVSSAVARRAPSAAALAVVLAAGTLSSQALAADLPADPSPAVEDSMPDLVVVGRRAEERPFEADRTVHRLSRSDLRRLQPQGVPEALQETSGVHVQITNRGAGAPYLRGLVGPQNLITVDGIRFNNSTFRTGPNQYLSLLDPSQIEAVEVLLGPGSVLYGSDAMGGVLQIVPSSWWGRGPGVRGGLQGASSDASYGLWGEGAWRNDSTAVLLGGAWRDFGTLTVGDGAKAPASDYRQRSYHGRVQQQLGEDLTLSAAWMGGRVQDQGRVDQLYKGQVRWYDNESDLGWLDLRWRPEGTLLREVRLALSIHRTDEVQDSFRCTLGKSEAEKLSGASSCIDAAEAVRDASGQATPGTPLTRHDALHDTVWTPGVLLTGLFHGWDGKLRVTVGTETYRDEVSSEKVERRGDKDPKWQAKTAARGNFSDGSTYLSAGGFAHADADVWAAGPQKLVVAAGARVSHLAAHADDVPGVGTVDYDFTGLVTSGGLRWLWERKVMAYLTFSQGFRAPNLQETTVLGNTGSKFEVPNAELEPEKSNTVELGTRVQAGPIGLHVAAFQSWLVDAIDERDVPQGEWAGIGVDAADVGCTDLADPNCKPIPVVQRVNAEEGQIYGAEVTAELGPWFGLRPWVHASWIEGDVTKASVTQPARRIPAAMGSAGLRWTSGDSRWYAEAFSRFAADQDRLHKSDRADLRMCENPAKLGTVFEGETCTGTPGWATVNLRGGWALGKNLRLDAALINLLDERYRLHGSGVEGPGRGASLSIAGQY